jgi:PAP2 superfamily
MKRALSLGTLVIALGFAAGVRADAITDWNVIAISTVPPAQHTGPSSTRVLSYMHLAMFDAVNSVERKYTPYKHDLVAPGASAESAAIAAAHGALAKVYPDQWPALDAALAKSLKALPDGKAKEDGAALGRMIVERSQIVFEDLNAPDPAFKLGSDAWSWQPPQGVPPRGATWHKLKPFVLTSADQFSLPGPLSVRSPEFAKEIDEVRRIGSRDSRDRSSMETATAIFWTVGPGPLYNEIARKESAAKGIDLMENARLFAVLNVAMADVSVATWHEKWRHSFLRPSTAIHKADTLDNPAIKQDASWQPLINVPAHPDYPSGHASLSAAAIAVLRKYFGTDEIASEPTYTHPAGGITLQWTTYTALIEQNGRARVLGGIHTRTACEHGNILGQQVGNYVSENFLLPVRKG